MIDKRNRTINKNKAVWFCISCSRRVISENKPVDCPCHNPQWVMETNFVVIK